MPRAFFFAVLLLCACRKESASASDAAVEVAPRAAAVPAQLQVTPEKVEAYLKYQRAVLDTAPEGALIDRARRDEAARKSAGLTEDELTRLDDMVSALVARRMLTKLTGSGAFMPDPKMMESLSPEQKKRLEEATAAYQVAQTQAKELVEERKRFGSANIDVLLKSEAELVKNWSRMMNIALP